MKNKKILALLLAATLATVGYVAYRFGVRQGSQAAPSGSAMVAASAANKKPLYWHDPMVPGQKFDKPGKSPFMDMQLVPVYAEADGDDAAVTISPRVQQNLGVRTATVTSGKLSAQLAVVGSVAYNERDVAVVQARSGGFVERLYVRAALDPVKQGQPLADVYVPDWIAVQEDYLAARRMQGSDTASLIDGARQRMRLAGMSDGQIQFVESSGKVHARLTMTAPISGVVAELGVREGMTVSAGAPLFRINGLSTVWVNAQVPESVEAKVRPGDAVEARTQALPASAFKGKVSAILPEINAATRTLTARVELANPRGQLLPGMFATLTFAPDSGVDVLLVPSEAVIQTGTRSVVMLAGEGGKFTPVEVEAGRESNGYTEIRKGLSAGQNVVVSAQFLVDSEASLKGTATRMGGAQTSAPDKVVPQHHGVGTIEQIGKEEITISHGPVASLQWGPMTMGFKPPPAGLPRHIGVGDKVVFDFRKIEAGGFEIVAIAPVAEAPKAGKQPIGGMTMPMAPQGAAK